MKKHNIVHIHCLDHPAVFDCIDQLYKYNMLFDGYKIATITKSNREPEINELVSSILTKLGYEVIQVGNDSLRESGHFFNHSLLALLKRTKTGLLFYCHSKGVCYHPESEFGKAAKLWTNILFSNTLNDIDSIPFTNAKYKTFGTCIVKTGNFLPDNIGEKFSYIGTFFWIKLSTLVNYKPKLVSKFELEGLPGLCCNISEAYNKGPIFLKSENPYHLKTWAKKGIEYGV